MLCLDFFSETKLNFAHVVPIFLIVYQIEFILSVHILSCLVSLVILHILIPNLCTWHQCCRKRLQITYCLMAPISHCIKLSLNVISSRMCTAFRSTTVHFELPRHSPAWNSRLCFVLLWGGIIHSTPPWVTSLHSLCDSWLNWPLNSATLVWVQNSCSHSSDFVGVLGS